MDTHKAHLPLEVVSIYKLLLRGGTRREHLCLMHYRGDTRLRHVFNKHLIVGTKFRINAASTCQWQNKTNAKLSLLKRVTVLKRIYINAEISAESLKKKKGRHSYRVSALIKERNVKTNGSEVISIVRLLLYAVRNPRQHFFAKEKAAHPVMGERQETLSM